MLLTHSRGIEVINMYICKNKECEIYGKEPRQDQAHLKDTPKGSVLICDVCGEEVPFKV